MKVILFENVENLGLPGEIAEVKPGYFRNFLSPRGIAVQATQGNLKSLELKRKKLQTQAAKMVKDAESLGAQLKAEKLRFVVKVGDNDRLFGSITTADIAEQLTELGYEVDKRRISLSAPIKTTGNYTARVRLEAGVAVPIAVIVEREGGEPGEAEKPKEKSATPAEPTGEAGAPTEA